MSLAKQGFRKLLKTALASFHGDQFAINEARKTLRTEFLANKNVTDPAQLESLFRGIEEIDEMLRFNIVQGKMNNRGNFDVKIQPEHHITLEAGQDEPHGSSFEPIDTTIAGGKVHVEKVEGKRCKK